MKQNRQNAADSSAGEQEEAVTQPETENLEDDLAAARKEAAETYDRLLRTTAEFENFKKRNQRQAEESRKYANASLIRDLLTVVDNLERAISVSSENLSSEESCMLEGVEMTLSEIHKILGKYNVTAIEARGKPFDPAYHEAVMQEESDVYPENTVTNELQKGYLLHDRLIRPSMVVVSKGSSRTESE